MHLSPDNIVFWQHGFFKINATIAVTWVIMIVLAAGSHLITRRLSTGLEISRWQNLLEIIVASARKQIGEVGLREPEKYLGFLGTLFSRLSASDRLALDHRSPGHLRFCRGPSLRHCRERSARLPGDLSQADLADVAVQYHQ
jgi:hypothetical protein